MTAQGNSHLPDCGGAILKCEAVQRSIDRYGDRSRPVRLRSRGALIALLCLSACASPWPRGPYAQIVLDRPLPVSEADRQTECAWIRYEIGRQQEITTRRAVFAEGREALLNRVNYEQNLIVLETRAKAARCNE